MDAIFTWKRLTSYDELESTFFWHYAKISTQTAGKFHNTILYTDEEGKKDFEKFGIGFNKVIVLPELESFKGSIFSIPKIYAMIQRKDPYVHLDFDVFTNIAHTTNEPIAFGYPEVNLKVFSDIIEIEYLNESYLKSYKEEFHKYYDCKDWDWRLVPNFGVFIVNNPSLVSDIFKDILNEIKDLKPNESKKHQYASFIEQFLFMRAVEEYDIDYEFIYDAPNFTFKDQNFVYVKDKLVNVSYKSGLHKHLNTLKFTHFHGYKKYPVFNNTIIKKLITKENPI